MGVALSMVLVAAGLAWEFGGWGLVGVGFAVLLVVLFVIDMKEG